LREAEDWERLKTNLPGVFILKLPAYKGNPARLAIELNPVDSSGAPTKKRGLIIRSSTDLNEYRKIIQEEKLSNLVDSIDRINPPLSKQSKTEVLEL